MANTLARIGSFFRSLIHTGQRSLEDPSTSLSDPNNWLADAFGATPAASGVSVTADSALRYSPWWRGITLVSSDVGKLPLFVYRRAGQGKERDPQHQAYRLLRYRANNELMSAFVFRQTLQAWAMSAGNGYAWIRRNGNARPLELLVLNPMDVYPFRENERLWYAVRVGFEWRRVNPTEIFHIKGLSPDGLVGYSVYQKAREALGEGMAAQEYSCRYFRNAARPSVVIEVPGTMREEDQRALMQQWERMHTGLENSHRTAILTNNGKVNPISINAKDSQLHESRKFNLVDIANYIGVPVHKVGGDGRTSYGSLEQENQAYLDESLDPWLVRWEDEAREKLLTEDEKNRDTHVVEFLRQALVRADIVARYTAHNIAVRGGWETRDEVRNTENKGPLPDGEGQKFFAPLELQIVGEDQPPEVDDLPGLLNITSAVTAGTLPHDSAKAMLSVTFPLLTSTQINAIVDPLQVTEPTDTKPDPDNPAPEPDTTSESSPQPTAAARTLVLDAMKRACTHLQIHATKRAKRAKNFLEETDTDRPQDELRVSEILDAPVLLCRAIGGTLDTAYISRFVLDEAKTALLLACDSAKSTEELVQSVELRMTELVSTLPERVADLLLPKESD